MIAILLAIFFFVSPTYAYPQLEFDECVSSSKDNPELVNEDAYGKGWIVKISDFNQEDIEELLNPDQYLELIK